MGLRGTYRVYTPYIRGVMGVCWEGVDLRVEGDGIGVGNGSEVGVGSGGCVGVNGGKCEGGKGMDEGGVGWWEGCGDGGGVCGVEREGGDGVVDGSG